MGANPNQATLPLLQARGILVHLGRVPKWLKGTDCKSVIRGFESRRGLSAPVLCTGAISLAPAAVTYTLRVLLLTAILHWAPPPSGVPEQPVRFNEGARVLSLNIRLEKHPEGTRLVPTSPSPTLPDWFQAAPCPALERLEEAGQKQTEQEWNIAAEVLMDRGRPVLLLTRDALRSGTQGAEPALEEMSKGPAFDTEQSEADEIAARLRAAAGTLLRAGTTATAPLPDDANRSARVVERQGRLVLCDKGFPRFVPEGAGQVGVVHPILPCRIRTAMSRVVARQGEGVRVRVTGRVHRYRCVDWLRPDRFQVVPAER